MCFAAVLAVQGCAAVLATMRLDPALGANAAIQAVGSAAHIGVVAAFREVGSAALAAPAAWASAAAGYVGGVWRAMLSSGAAQAALAVAPTLAAALAGALAGAPAAVALLLFTATARVRNTARRDKLVQLREAVDQLVREEDTDDWLRATDRENLVAVGLGGSPSCHRLRHSSSFIMF